MITRRPSLLGRTAKTVARTAVIAGTATAVAGRVAGRQAGAQPTGSEPAAQGLTSDALEQLKKLAELHAAGVLTDEEFATQKARLLS
jgi:hypothetical protein